MVEINPETQKTRKERLATVITLGVSAFVHLFVFVGGIQFYKWVEEEEKKERLMVIRRITESAPEPPRTSQPAPSRPAAPKEASLVEKGEEPPPDEGNLVEGIEHEIAEEAEGETPVPEEEDVTESVVSVVTDLSAATFTVSGPMEFHGAGTFWTRKDVPTGSYTATFHPVTGYRTPAIQTKALEEKSKIIFVGKYTRSVEVKVALNEVPGASFEIRRPDGKTLPMNRAGRAFFENLPPGTYTIVFHDVPGYLTPAPQTKTLGRGGGAGAGGLSFAGSYLPGGGGRGGSGSEPVRKTEDLMDRRVQMVVKSYPATNIEDNFDYIRYPEIIIKRSNFQRGWCRVYLVLDVDGSGRIESVSIERPRSEEREQFASLIQTVENSVRRWRYDRTRAEVHVDVRFYVE